MLLFTLLVTGIISLLTGSIYFSSKAERVKAFDRRLKGRANYNVYLYEKMGDSAAFTFMRRTDSASMVGALGSRSIAIFTEDGKPVYRFEIPGSKPLNFNDSFFCEVREKGEIGFTLDTRDAIALHRVTSTRN